MESTGNPSSLARPKSSALTWLYGWGPKVVAGLALAVVAGVTGRISYTHIEALTLALGQPLSVARLMPFGVDGLVIVGAVVLLQAVPGQDWIGWLGVGPGVAASLFANWESGIRSGVLAAIWATVPAVSFALACFLFERWLYAQVSHASQDGRTGRANTDTDDGDNSGENTNTCPHRMAESAEDGLVQAFLHIRDCLWEEPSQRKLSAAFGINRLRVAELVKPYLPEAAPEPSPNGSTSHD